MVPTLWQMLDPERFCNVQIRPSRSILERDWFVLEVTLNLLEFQTPFHGQGYLPWSGHSKTELCLSHGAGTGQWLNFVCVRVE